MAKIKMKNSVTVADTFHDFLVGKKAAGVSEKTLLTYGQHFSAVNKHLSPDTPMDALNKADLEDMISSMRDAGLAANSIKSYTRTLKSFLSWCNEAGITRLNIQLYKAEETIKETYSDEELKKLLKKPNMKKCTFAEYRNWVIINLLPCLQIPPCLDFGRIPWRPGFRDFPPHTKTPPIVPLGGVLCKVGSTFLLLFPVCPCQVMFSALNGVVELLATK